MLDDLLDAGLQKIPYPKRAGRRKNSEAANNMLLINQFANYADSRNLGQKLCTPKQVSQVLVVDAADWCVRRGEEWYYVGQLK
jgi:hypothetical protein